MPASELELYTTQELIAELMRRQTFYGVVVHATDQNRGGPWQEERMFRVHFNHHLDKAEASRLLSSVAEYIDHHLT